MKAPKEIWVLNAESIEDNIFTYLRIKTSGRNRLDEFKYISEQHHNEQIEVLKKEIEELKYQLASRNS